MTCDAGTGLSRAVVAFPSVLRASSRFGLGASVGATIVVLSLFHGGYAPVAWGWTALLGFWVSILALAFRSEQVVDRAVVALVGGFAAVAGWTALSATWTQSVPRTMLELERDLVYVAVATAVLLLCTSAGGSQLVWGLCAGLVVVGALSAGLYFFSRPELDVTQGYLLFRPVGYANAVGGLMALALPLLFALAAVDPRPTVKAAAGAAVVVSSVVLYLTQNRAGYVALGVACIVWISRTDAPASATATIIGLAIPTGAALVSIKLLGLLDTDTHRQVADLGARRVGGGLIVLSIAVLASRMPRLTLRCIRVRGRAQVGAVTAAALVSVAFCSALFGPGNRAEYWRVAWHTFERHPLLGSGAGTFGDQWLRYRGSSLSVQDAHSLYLETLSELGVVGLLLLVGLLVIPIVVCRRSRDPLTTACLASYCAFLVHAAFEWDWEMPVVTVSGLMLASALVTTRVTTTGFALSRFARRAGVAVVALVAAFAVVALVGNSAVVSAEQQIGQGHLQAAAARATWATHVLPWSSEPWLVIADVRARSFDQEGSRVALRKAIARDDADWALWFRLAVASHGNERAVALRRAIALDPRLFSGVEAGS